MSPKGGIKPHKRFSIQAKRSEVLFVDYMAEHLTPTGRAGIIVPEGIIFQSQGAYKDLRKLLVENSLVVVVSLPAGCFNPYSGVKTSILILDKSLARQSDTVAFFKVENDGFGLGAQRRAFDKNDLPQVKADLVAYLSALRTGESTDNLQLINGLIVPKATIEANGDYNLSGERYREGSVAVSSWPFVPVGDVFRKSERTVLPESLDGPVTYLGLENISQNTGETEGIVVTDKPADIKSLKNVFKPRDILYGKLRPNLNKVWLSDRNGICSTDIFVIETLEGAIDPAFYAYVFRSSRFNDAVMGQLKGAQLPRIGWSSFAELQIPLPPLEVQKEIRAEIDGYQNIIHGARVILDNYRPHIPIHPEWPVPTFESAPFKIIDGDRGSNYPSKEDFSRSGDCLFLNTKNVRSDGFRFDEVEFISAEKDQALRKGKLVRGDVVLTTRGTIGNTALYDDSVAFANVRINSGMLIFRPDADRISSSYLFHYFQSENFRAQREAIASGSAQPQLPIRSLNEARIPLPPLTTQEEIVAEIEAEQALIAVNRKLISRFERKIQTTLARVWGDENSIGNAPANG
jgi:type I restriction enzyme M protein